MTVSLKKATAVRGSTAVMAARHEPPDSLEYFPTPPWATRALCKHVIPNWVGGTVWEPACGEGHMACVLDEFFNLVIASDVFAYDPIFEVMDFLHERVLSQPDWIITNPPFSVALDFTLRAIEIATVGTAMLVRTNWLESVGRYERLFKEKPPTIFAPFVERVPMVKGRWDPTASTATAYAWFCWINGVDGTSLKLIPPGCRRSLTLPGDVERFGHKTDVPLFDPVNSGDISDPP